MQQLGGFYFDIDAYRRYGTPTPLYRWGDRVFQGLHQDLVRYPHLHRFNGMRICYGHFILPEPFSRAAAYTPRRPDEQRFYPAVFALAAGPDQDMLIEMACFAIILGGSRPWTVHRSRVLLLEEVGQTFEDILNFLGLFF